MCIVVSLVLTSIVSVIAPNFLWPSKMPVHKPQSVNLPASLMVSILKSSLYTSFYTDRDALIQQALTFFDAWVHDLAVPLG